MSLTDSAASGQVPIESEICAIARDNYDNNVPMPFATSSCSIQCLNCERLTQKLARVYDEMHKLRRQNENLLAQAFDPEEPYAYDGTRVQACPRSKSNTLVGQKMRWPDRKAELDEKNERSKAEREKAGSQQSRPMNFIFSVNMNFLPENSLTVTEIPKCRSSESIQSCKSLNKKKCSSQISAPYARTSAMITIQMKMMDEMLEGPTITCIENKSGGEQGHGKWRVQVKSSEPSIAPRLDSEVKAEWTANKINEKMRNEVTHLLQTIRQFFDRQIKEQKPSSQCTVEPIIMAGAKPKVRIRGPPKRSTPSRNTSASTLSSSSSETLVYSDHSSSSSRTGIGKPPFRCPICFMVFPFEFNKEEKDEHTNCHLWPRY